MDPITTKDWQGIDNIHNDVELGESVLRNTSNVDLSPSGKIRSRLGYARLDTGAAHSGFGFAGHLIYVKSGMANAYDVRSGATAILFPVSGSSLAHVEIDGTCYLSDGASKWKVDANLVVSAWGKVADDDPNFDARTVIDFPPCTKLTHFKGRMVGAVGNAVVYSLPWVFGSVDAKAGFFPVRGKINVLHGNEDALFIGADDLVAVGGLGDDLTPLATVIPVKCFDSVPTIDPDDDSAYWMTERGVVVVGKSGNQARLVVRQDMIAFRKASTAAVGIIKRDGATSVVATMVPDTSLQSSHPLVSRDFTASDLLMKEIYDAL